LVNSEKLIYSDSKGRAKQFYLFGDVHHSSHADKEQLAAMQSILANRECKETDQLHILIEQPTSVLKIFNNAPTVLMDLTQHIKDLSYTRAENTEIRCVGHAATFLFQPKTNPFDVFPKLGFDTAKRHCIVEEITLADLGNEFFEYKKEAQQFENFSISSNIKKIIEREVSTLDQYYQEFLRRMKELFIKDNDSLLSVSKTMYQEEQHDKRISIYLDIRDLFARLFDLNIFKRMIEINESKIALFAGVLHTIFVKQMLEEAGARALIFHTSGFDLSCNNVVPLEPKYLDIFTEPAWYERCTVL